jgi:hypothetical protein
LKLLKMLRPPQAFPDVDLRALVKTEDHARRFLLGNASDQIGLFKFMENKSFQKQSLKLLDLAISLEKNFQSYEVCQKFLGRERAQRLASWDLGHYLDVDNNSKQQVVRILDCFLSYSRNACKDLETILPSDQERQVYL